MTPRHWPLLPFLAAFALAGCREPAPAVPEPEVEEETPPLRSIIRDDIEAQVPVVDEVEVPMELTVTFADPSGPVLSVALVSPSGAPSLRLYL